MSNEPAHILDKRLLNHFDNRHRLDIYVANGLKFTGTLVEFDAECLVINGKAQEQVIMRQAIITVQRCTTLNSSVTVTHKPARRPQQGY